MHKQTDNQSKENHHSHIQEQAINIIDFLPGKATRASIKNQMLRVDHAGEFGAIHIYRGQLAVYSKNFSKHQTYKTIKNMEQQEQAHLEKFKEVLPSRKIRPTFLSALWKRGGFLLGATSALVSEKAAMACTEAVETVIDTHYDKQISFFSKDNDELLPSLKQFQQDELSHKQEASDLGASEAVFYKPAVFAIKTLCQIAIKVAHKI